MASSPSVFPWSFFCVNPYLCLQFLLLGGHQPYWIRYWGVGLQHKNFGKTQFIPWQAYSCFKIRIKRLWDHFVMNLLFCLGFLEIPSCEAWDQAHGTYTDDTQAQVMGFSHQERQTNHRSEHLLNTTPCQALGWNPLHNGIFYLLLTITQQNSIHILYVHIPSVFRCRN